MGHHRFLPLNYTLRKKGKHFKGKAEHRTTPDNRSGEDVFNMVKDVQVVFRKGLGSQPVPNAANEYAPM
jgi:inhibitor of KinA sporulation pathway (predicted exonuclease)